MFSRYWPTIGLDPDRVHVDQYCYHNAIKGSRSWPNSNPGTDAGGSSSGTTAKSTRSGSTGSPIRRRPRRPRPRPSTGLCGSVRASLPFRLGATWSPSSATTDGPRDASADVRELTLAELRATYFAAHKGKLEDSTLADAGLHFDHLVRHLGPDVKLTGLTRAGLQAYADKRAKEWIDPNVYRRIRRERDAAMTPRKNRMPPPPESEDKPRRHPSSATIRKELTTLRAAWNWARGQFGLAAEYPGAKLAFAKTDAALPYMTWAEAERRVAAGADSARVWECLYLRPPEVAELLAWVKARPVSPWV